MFRAARWRSEKNRTKAVFKLQFHAAQVLQLESEAVMVSLVPADGARPTASSDKVAAVDGVCNWANPVFESVKLVRNPKNGKMDEKVYRFLVSAAESRKAEILGEASLNLADYAEVFKPSSVALPLKGSSTGAILHITIQRMQGDGEGREGDEGGEMMVKRQRRTLQSQLGKWDEDGSHINDQARDKFRSSRDISHHNADSNGVLQKSHSFDAISASGSDTSSGVYTPRENSIVLKQHSNQRDPTSFLSPLTRMFSSDDLSGASAPDGSADASTSSSGDAGLNETSRDSEDSIEKLKSDVDMLTRKVEVSDLELQTLRKQIIKENKRSQDLLRELSCVKEERDALKRGCDGVKISEKRKQSDGSLSVSTVSRHDGEDLISLLEEIKQELDHEKNLNVHLRLQLKMTQEANSDLAVAVKDLDGVLGQKSGETFCTKCGKVDINTEVDISQNDSEEQYALDALVNGRDDMKVSYSLENKIIDLNNEVEYYRKDREDLEMQMEQLALDYEILKQENHDITAKMEQMQLREQLRMQYECSAHLAIISELEANVECLEKELQKQVEAFEEDIAVITRAKIEQEKRAIKAEEELRTTKWKHSKNVERLQEEFRRISSHMSTTFQVNEKMFMQALKENAELRSQRSSLEDLLEKSNKHVVFLQDQYRMKLTQLLGLIDFKSKEVDTLLLELRDKKTEFENYKKSEERRNNSLIELELLKREIENLNSEKSFLSKECEQSENLLDEVKLLRASITENEKSVKEKDPELDSRKIERAVVLRDEGSKSSKEINEPGHMRDEKDTVIDILKSEASLGQHKDILKHTLYENEVEKLNLEKSILYSRSTLLEETQMSNTCEEKVDGNCATTSANGQASDYSIDLKKDPSNTIEKMPEFIQDDEQFHQSSVCTRKDSGECTHGANDTNKELPSRTASLNSDENQILVDQKDAVDALSEMAALKEQNKSMGSELKELQERYSEISLKFAEVEGERQQLLMTVRSLKNASKN